MEDPGDTPSSARDPLCYKSLGMGCLEPPPHARQVRAGPVMGWLTVRTEDGVMFSWILRLAEQTLGV